MTKTLQRLKRVVYWSQVRVFIRHCEVCQSFKYENIHHAGLLQPLPIPDQAWEEISMNFIEGLSKIKGKFNILVVINRLTKFAHFFPLSPIHN